MTKKRARTDIDADDAVVLVSAVSAWEIANKVRTGKWPQAAPIAARFTELMTQHGFHPLPVTVDHAQFAGAIPGPHRDPFDRLLAAQARIENIPLISADPAFRTLGVNILW